MIDVHILTDEPEKYPDYECQRMFSPWKAWARIASIQSMPASPSAKVLAKMGLASGQVLIGIAANDRAQTAIDKAGKELGLNVILPSHGTPGSLDAGLLREVSHFDFELGGKNEWDGAPTQQPAACLRHLSSTHSRDFYPTWVFDPLLGNKRGPRDKPLKVMDIGCGPVSVLRWGAIHGEISITGLDPLIDLYAVVLARHGLDALPKIRCDREAHGFAEDMEELVPDGDFDVIYTQNALDHTQKPALVIQNMSKKLRPKGHIAIQVATREGTRQKWDQLHKTDIYLEKNVLMFNHQNTAPIPLLSPESRLRLKHVQLNTPDWLACIVEKS
jgi:SAM-dependent methyltransferase